MGLYNFYGLNYVMLNVNVLVEASKKWLTITKALAYHAPVKCFMILSPVVFFIKKLFAVIINSLT